MKRLAFAAALLAASSAFAAARVAGVVEPEAAIGRTLTLRVEGDPGPCGSLILFIERSPIHGLTPRCGNGTVAFPLAVNEKNAERWHRILGGRMFRRTVIVGLGPNDQFPFETIVENEPFRILVPWRMVLMGFIALILFTAIVLVRRFTTALDSLARTQIAVWLVVIALAYAYIWSVTGELETISAGALALLGIGAGTAIGAAILKDAKRVDAKTIVQAISNASGEEVTPVEAFTPKALEAWQAAAWTSVLAVIFLASVVRYLEMPDFNGNVLAMAGISGGTYVAFALPRRH